MPIKPVPAVKKLVIIEEAMLVSMARSANFIKEFPFLREALSVEPTGGGCGGCGHASNTQRASVLTTIKQNLAGMADDRKQLLKRLLNTQKIRLTYRQGRQIVQHTF